MYTEKQMQHRIRKLRRRIKKAGGVDLLVTHAPVRGLGDLEDLPHRGFSCFEDFLTEYKPQCMLHGHVHQAYDYSFKRERLYESGIRIINCSGSYMLEI
jgi:Icc-related predicted phosphoesterase